MVERKEDHPAIAYIILIMIIAFVLHFVVVGVAETVAKDIVQHNSINCGGLTKWTR